MAVNIIDKLQFLSFIIFISLLNLRYHKLNHQRDVLLLLDTQIPFKVQIQYSIS